jgi:hypothetical protein
MPDNFISAVRGYLRLGNFPLDASSVYETFEAASEYASSNPTAYPGQLVAVTDEVNRTVTIYQLGFKSDPEASGFELESLVAGQVGTVKSINGIFPDEDGNVTISLEALDDILTFLQNTETRVVFNKPIQVPTLDISQDDDVITKKYLEATFNSSLNGLSRAFYTSFTHEGGITSKKIPAGSTIKSVSLVILQAFDPSDITISIGGHEIYNPTDIYETQTGIFIAEPYKRLPTTDPTGYPVEIVVDESTKGSAELYIDFNINFTD